MSLPSTRKTALEQKSKYYFTGKKCINGHIEKRITSNGLCYECCQKASLQCYYNNKKSPEKRKIQILNKIKNRAKREGQDFDLTVENIKWPTHCPVFGYELSYEISDKDKSVSFDKHDPNKGYTKDNVNIMSLRANRAKWNLNIEEVRLIYEYLLSKS